jgi:hypothetical protein
MILLCLLIGSGIYLYTKDAGIIKSPSHTSLPYLGEGS